MIADLEEDGYFGEVRHLYSLGEHFSLTAGLGYRNANSDSEIVFNQFPSVTEKGSVIHRNGYIYSSIEPIPELSIILGLSGDSYDDGFILEADEQLNPKFGIIWQITDSLILRAAAFRIYGRTLSSTQTIEPTNIAGFNQFFDDAVGSSSKRYGIGLDKEFDINPDLPGSELFGGLEFSIRQVERRTLDPVTSIPVGLNIDEKSARAYIYWTPNDHFGISLDYIFEDEDPSRDALSIISLADYKSHRIPLEIRAFAKNGIFGFARATFVDQSGIFPTREGSRAKGSDRSLITDGGIGYRLPDRFGSVALEVRNLFDTDFRFQDVEPRNPDLSNERTFLFRINLTF